MLRDNFDEALFQLKHVIDLTLDVARRSLRPPRDLVDHDIGIRQREPFAFRAGAKQNCGHACSHAEAIRCHIARQELHGVVNRESCRYRSTRRVDVDVDVLLRVLHLQKEQLRDDQVGNVIVHRRPNENDPVLEQP